MQATIQQNTVHEIDRQRAADFLWNETGGRIFSAYFRKADGDMRTMVCRRGVKSQLRGGQLPYDAKKLHLLPVFEMSPGQYRMVNLGTLVSFSVGGETFIVT